MKKGIKAPRQSPKPPWQQSNNDNGPVTRRFFSFCRRAAGWREYSKSRANIPVSSHENIGSAAKRLAQSTLMLFYNYRGLFSYSLHQSDIGACTLGRTAENSSARCLFLSYPAFCLRRRGNAKTPNRPWRGITRSFRRVRGGRHRCPSAVIPFQAGKSAFAA